MNVARVDDAWIDTRDGTRLSVRLWLPETDERVPAILEYIPYRKDDATAPRDEALHGQLAQAGFACARVDARGSGDSEGVLAGEYLQQELDDGVDAIAWLTEQPWCNGRVGMIGKSWGGFNGLQIAALAPPALHGVVSVCSTDDRYRDDVHYTGGCVFAQAALSWSTTMLAYTARPPDPAVVGERWRDLWQQRLDAIAPFGHEWLAHQRRDEFWRHGSVCEDPAAIRCPIYMVGGWADMYRGSVLRLLAAAPDRVRGLIGPWAHVYPHQGAPGPAIDFLSLCRRFFDRHLRGTGEGLDGEPALRAWMQEPVPPQPGYDVRPGRWVAEAAWPPAREPLRLTLGEDDDERVLDGLLAHGQDGSTWLPWGSPADFAADQRGEDGRALVWDLPPLDRRVELLGEPALELEVVPEAETGQLAVRLCDVAPGGASTLVTFGLLNLCHRNGHAEPEPLVPGEPVRVRVQLTAIAYAFPAGHRIRVAVAPSYWPWAWPSGSLRLRVRGAATLELPARRPRPEDDALPELPPPPSQPRSIVEQLAPVEVRRRTSRDVETGLLESVSELSYFGSFRLADGLIYAERGRDAFTVVEGEPLSAEARSSWKIAIGRDDWQTRVEVESSMRADASAFRLDDVVRAFEGEEQVAERTFSTAVPRDLA